MDTIDLALLQALQEDCSAPLAELASSVSIGPTACWRRVQKLEESGHILSRVALLDRKQLNVNVTVFVALTISQHNADWLDAFHTHISVIPEVLECYRMAGDTDYLLRVVVPDIEAYDRVYKRIIMTPGLSDVSSSFAMEQIKYTTKIPLYYANYDRQ